MTVKQYLKTGMMALGLFVFNYQVAHSMPDTPTCGASRSMGTTECTCCNDGPGWSTLYTNLEDCSWCAKQLGPNRPCAVGTKPPQQCWGG